jgi:hypothetical protein
MPAQDNSMPVGSLIDVATGVPIRDPNPTGWIPIGHGLAVRADEHSHQLEQTPSPATATLLLLF